MLKNKSINRLISKLSCTGLLIGTLPIGLVLNGQSQKMQEPKNVRMEVDREVAVIKKTVARLKTAKIITPVMFMGAGIAVTATVMAMLCLFSGLKLGKGIQEVQKKLFEIKRNSVRYYDIQSDEYWVHKALEAVENFIPKNILYEAHERVFTQATQETPGLELIRDITEKILEPKQSSLIFWTLFSSVVGVVGTAMVSISSFFSSSKIPVTEAYNSVKKIELIKKKYPGILTPQQDFVLLQLKTLSKGVITGEIIKKVRLEDALMEVTDTAVQQHFLLVSAPGKKREAHKIFTTYIELRYQKKLFEKTLTADTGIITSFFTTFQLRRVKKKIAKLEVLHPQIRAALEDAVQIYTTKVNDILEELRD